MTDVKDVKIVVGTTLEAEIADVADVWKRAVAGEDVQQHVVSFESWDALKAVLSTERLRLLRHVRSHPVRSIRALSQALGRDYSPVHGDVTALVEAGLLERSAHAVRAPAARLVVEVPLD